MSGLARDGLPWLEVMSLVTGPKSLLSTAIFLWAYNNCMNIFPTGHWPLTGHWITKSCWTDFLLPAKRDLLCPGHLRCAELAYNRWIKKHKICCHMETKPAVWQHGWPSCVPALPFASSVALRWLHFCSSLCQRQTLSSCFRSVCDKRVDFWDKPRQDSYQASQWSGSFDRCCYPKWIW